VKTCKPQDGKEKDVSLAHPTVDDIGGMLHVRGKQFTHITEENQDRFCIGALSSDATDWVEVVLSKHSDDILVLQIRNNIVEEGKDYWGEEGMRDFIRWLRFHS
jgi:hypothetical protein